VAAAVAAAEVAAVAAAEVAWVVAAEAGYSFHQSRLINDDELIHRAWRNCRAMYGYPNYGRGVTDGTIFAN
jgi:hypothetical protein